jgi:hypothetical protein
MPPLPKQIMQYGDKVVVFFDPSTQFLILLQEKGVLDCKFGHFNHSNFVGQEIGSKVNKKPHPDTLQSEIKIRIRTETGQKYLYQYASPQDSDIVFCGYLICYRKPGHNSW